MIVELGDIVAIRGTGWFADHICKANHSEVSHIGVITGIGAYTQITEAVSRVRTVPLEVSLKDVEEAYLLKCNLSDSQRVLIAETALSFSTASYGYYEILLQGLDVLFNSRVFTDTLSFNINKHPICSYVGAKSYEAADISFRDDNQSITPNDIYLWPNWTTKTKIKPSIIGI